MNIIIVCTTTNKSKNGVVGISYRFEIKRVYIVNIFIFNIIGYFFFFALSKTFETKQPIVEFVFLCTSIFQIKWILWVYRIACNLNHICIDMLVHLWFYFFSILSAIITNNNFDYIYSSPRKSRFKLVRLR
jgi:hypothetical protein